MRLLCAALGLSALSWGAILPETIGTFHRAADVPLNLADKAVWTEYGLKQSESARYEDGKANFTVTIWQLQDTTGSLAAYDWQRPADAAPSKLAPMAAETPKNVLLVYGNYLVAFAGHKPEPAEWTAFTDPLKNLDTTSLPSLPTYFPASDLVPNSERYITGPASLARFLPAVSPSAAGFHFGAEAQLGVFHSPKGDTTLAIFAYPNHQMAKKQEPELAKLPGAMVKRSGPLVAVVLSPPDLDAAERILGNVRYQANVTRDEYVPTRRDNIGNLVTNAFTLIGILLAFATLSGLMVGGFRAFRRRGGRGDEADALQTLHINGR
jgi:hypothetical protein